MVLICIRLSTFCRFGRHFEYPLLIQSIIMNVTMFMMIHLCVQVRNKNQLMQARQRIFAGKHTFSIFIVELVNMFCAIDQ